MSELSMRVSELENDIEHWVRRRRLRHGTGLRLHPLDDALARNYDLGERIDQISCGVPVC